MSTLGSVIDAFIIGHTMRTTDVGALSLTSPIWFVMAIIYGILAIGSQPFCSGELGRGNKEAARKIFSMTLITGIGITLLFSLLIFAFGGLPQDSWGRRRVCRNMIRVDIRSGADPAAGI